ncbi:hypothetical protein BGZ89_007695 [Linnemannia elongata]|nr:hypothetical protein BGZ89_007695 [Linnemannia elongata]
MDVDVCSNFIYTEGAVMVDSLLSADITGGDGGLCSPPAFTSGTLAFPKPKPGDYNCDAPPKLATSMLDYVRSVANISFGIMTGDILPHDAWFDTPENIIPQLKAAFDAMAIIKAKIYPAIGNLEASPLNMFSTPKSGGDQLQAAEDIGERVWVIGHVPPSQVDCINNWSSLYRQVVARYSPHVIIEQFFGHSHYDEFSLTYGLGGKSAQNAVSTSWIGPSVTPYTNLNPAFCVYKVDTKSWNVFESLTYVADLNMSASWDATDSSPNWHLEYSARQTYSTYVPIAADQPLSAGWWHNATNVLESNPAAFKQYWSLRGHSANRLPDSVVVPLKKRDDNYSHDASAAGADMSPNLAASVITGIRSLSELRPNAKPWNKKLC